MGRNHVLAQVKKQLGADCHFFDMVVDADYVDPSVTLRAAESVLQARASRWIRQSAVITFRLFPLHDSISNT